MHIFVVLCVCKMEATLEKYQRRFEEMEDLQLQNKQLDELNTKYLDQVKPTIVKLVAVNLV